MNKRFVLLALNLVIASFVVVGCGKSTTNAITTEELESKETVTEAMAPTIEEPISEPEPEPTPDPEVVRAEDALNKINLTVDAYNELIANEELYAYCAQYHVEYDEEIFPKDSKEMYAAVKTKDGKVFTDYGVFAVCSYYNNYVNKENKYYSLADWVANYETADKIQFDFFGTNDAEYINKEYYNSESDVYTYLLNKITMWNVVKLVPYLSQVSEITLGDYKEDTSINVCGIDSAYTYPLILDGQDMGLFGIYDSDGNLLTIGGSDEFKNNVFTWIDGLSINEMIPQKEEKTTEATE